MHMNLYTDLIYTWLLGRFNTETWYLLHLHLQVHKDGRQSQLQPAFLSLQNISCDSQEQPWQLMIILLQKLRFKKSVNPAV